jgi:Flp pilus assembly protein TadB
MFIWPFISIIGLMFVDRTIAEVEKLRLFPSASTSKLRILSFMVVIIMNWILKKQLLSLWMLVFVVFLTPSIAICLIRSQRELKLKSAFIPILDNIILAMRSGKGFISSLKCAVEYRGSRNLWAFQEFISSLEYSRDMAPLSGNKDILFFFKELKSIHQSGHKPIERVKALRQRLFIEKDLRLKSRQALLQVKFQSYMMALMFIGLLFFVHVQFGIQNHATLVLGAVFLFLPGLIWIKNMGRGYKWKL